MSVDAISFSAHADFPQTSEFIDELEPKHVVLVHGEATEMGRLKRALEQRASATGQQRALYMPRVTQPVHISHKTLRTAKASCPCLFAAKACSPQLQYSNSLLSIRQHTDDALCCINVPYSYPI